MIKNNKTTVKETTAVKQGQKLSLWMTNELICFEVYKIEGNNFWSPWPQWITSNFLNLIYNDHITWSLFIKFESVTIPIYLCVPYFFRLTFLGLFPRIPELRLHSSLISLTMVLSTRSSEFSSSGRTYSFLSARRLHNSSSCLRIVSWSRAISCLCSCMNSEKQTITGSQFTKGTVTNSFFTQFLTKQKLTSELVIFDYR